MKKFKKRIENEKNLKNLWIHLRIRIFTRGNLLGYVKVSKVQKNIELQKKHTEEERELDHVLVM